MGKKRNYFIKDLLIIKQSIAKNLHNYQNVLLIISCLLLPFLPIASLSIFFIFSVYTMFDKKLLIFLRREWIIVVLCCTIYLSIIISSLNAFNPLQSILFSFIFSPFFVLFFASIKNLTINKSKFILKAIIFSSVIVSILAIVEFITGWYGIFNISLNSKTSIIFHPRSTSVFDNSNTLASYLIIILGLILGLLISNFIDFSEQEIKQKINHSLVKIKIFTYVLLVAIASTQSRNGLIVCLLLITISIMITKKERKFLFSLGFISLCSFYLIKYLTLLRVLNGSLNIQSQNIMLSISTPLGMDTRSVIWKFAISLFYQRPWLGWGLGNYQLLYPVQHFSTPPHPHNLWLMLLAETGLIGFISWNIFVGFILFRGFLAVKSLTPNEQIIFNSCLMSFLGTIIFHLFDCTFFDSRINVINWLNLAIIYQLSNQPNQQFRIALKK